MVAFEALGFAVEAHRVVDDLADRSGLGELIDDGWSAATIDAALTPLRAYYRRALVRGDVHHNPTAGTLKPAVRSEVNAVADNAEVMARLALVEGDDRVLWATAFYAGLRRGELIGLHRDDVDLAAGLLRVRRGWDMEEGEIEPKGRQGKRTVPIPAALRDYLDEYLLITPVRTRLFSSAGWVCPVRASGGRAPASRP